VSAFIASQVSENPTGREPVYTVDAVTGRASDRSWLCHAERALLRADDRRSAARLVLLGVLIDCSAIQAKPKE